MMLDITSAPTASACSCAPLATSCARRRQRIGKPGAGRAEIESPGPRRADLVLQQARRAREHHVGRRRADDDEAEIVGGDARPARCACSAASFARSDVATPGSTMCRSLMPVRCRIHSWFVSTMPLEIVVGQQSRRHVGGEPADATGRNPSRRTAPRFAADVPSASVRHHSLVLSRRVEAEVVVGPRRRHAAARRAIEEADLDQERLVDVLDRVAFLADRRGDACRARPDRPRTCR